MGVDAFAGHLVVAERRDGRRGRARSSRSLDGADPFGEDLDARRVLVERRGRRPRRYSARAPSTPPRRSASSQTSLVTPTRRLRRRLADGTRTLRKRQLVRGGYDATRFVSARLWVTARDGTEVPVSLVHRVATCSPRAARRRRCPRPRCRSCCTATARTRSAIDPIFTSSRLPLLERGVAFAIAHVRGGRRARPRLVRGGPPRAQGRRPSSTSSTSRRRSSRAASRRRAPGGDGRVGGRAADGGVAWTRRRTRSARSSPRSLRRRAHDDPRPLAPPVRRRVGGVGRPAPRRGAYRRLKSCSPYDNVVAPSRTARRGVPRPPGPRQPRTTRGSRSGSRRSGSRSSARRTPRTRRAEDRPRGRARRRRQAATTPGASARSSTRGCSTASAPGWPT